MGLEQIWKGILGRIQPLSKNIVDAYVADSMGVFITKQPMNFNEVEHIHRGFEFMGSPGDPTSPSRFVRAELLRLSAFYPKNTQQSIGLALQIIQTIAVPCGTVMVNVPIMNSIGPSGVSSEIIPTGAYISIQPLTAVCTVSILKSWTLTDWSGRALTSYSLPGT